jgi:hypothetical protein
VTIIDQGFRRALSAGFGPEAVVNVDLVLSAKNIRDSNRALSTPVSGSSPDQAPGRSSQTVRPLLRLTGSDSSSLFAAFTACWLNIDNQAPGTSGSYRGNGSQCQIRRLSSSANPALSSCKARRLTRTCPHDL